MTQSCINLTSCKSHSARSRESHKLTKSQLEGPQLRHGLVRRTPRQQPPLGPWYSHTWRPPRHRQQQQRCDLYWRLLLHRFTWLQILAPHRRQVRILGPDWRHSQGRTAPRGCKAAVQLHPE